MPLDSSDPRAFAPDLIEAATFLDWLAPGVKDFTFAAFPEARAADGSKRADQALTGEFHGTLDQCAAELTRRNELGAGIFYTVNRTNLKGRKASDILGVRAFWCDDDNGRDIQFPLAPDVTLATSGIKRQHLWIVEGLSAEDHARLMAVMVERYGSDPGAKDLSRVLRLPGFCHMKGTPQLVRIVGGRFSKDSSCDEYTREQIFAAFQPPELKLAPSAPLPNRIRVAGELDTEGAITTARAIAAARPAAEEGERNRFCYNLACRLYDEGISPQTCLELVLEWNDRNKPPLDEDEVERTVNSAATSKQDPIGSKNHDNAFDIIPCFDWRTAKGQEPAKPASKHDLLEQMNAKYSVIKNLGGKCLVVHETDDPILNRQHFVKQSFDSIKQAYCNQKLCVGLKADGSPKLMGLGAWWLEHAERRQFESLVFAPRMDIPGAYNLWRGFAYEPTPGIRHKRYLAHLYRNICQRDPVQYRFLVQWMALNVQRPAQQGHVAIVIRGKKGTGKSITGEHYGQLFGRHYLHITNADHLTGNFNSHLRDTKFLLADEAFNPKSKKHDGLLKTLITEPTITIEAKGVDVESAPNFLSLMMCSNDEGVVAASDDERRYFVLEASDAHIQDIAYFKSMATELEAGGYGDLLGFLLRLDLTGFEPRRVPRTEALERQKSLNSDAWADMLDDLLGDVEAGKLPGTMIWDALGIKGGHGDRGRLEPLMNKRGWIYTRLRWQGKPTWVWTRGNDGPDLWVQMTSDRRNPHICEVGFNDDGALPAEPLANENSAADCQVQAKVGKWWGD